MTWLVEAEQEHTNDRGVRRRRSEPPGGLGRRQGVQDERLPQTVKFVDAPNTKVTPMQERCDAVCGAKTDTHERS